MNIFLAKMNPLKPLSSTTFEGSNCLSKETFAHLYNIRRYLSPGYAQAYNVTGTIADEQGQPIRYRFLDNDSYDVGSGIRIRIQDPSNAQEEDEFYVTQLYSNNGVLQPHVYKINCDIKTTQKRGISSEDIHQLELIAKACQQAFEDRYKAEASFSEKLQFIDPTVKPSSAAATIHPATEPVSISKKQLLNLLGTYLPNFVTVGNKS